MKISSQLPNKLRVLEFALKQIVTTKFQVAINVILKEKSVFAYFMRQNLAIFHIYLLFWGTLLPVDLGAIKKAMRRSTISSLTPFFSTSSI